MTGPARTVALVDDHELLSYTLGAALAQVGIGCQTISPGPFEALLATLVEQAPTVVLLDLDLGEYGTALPLIEPLTAAGIRVIVLTAETDRIRLAETIEAGAIRVVTKSAAFTDLVDAIGDVVVRNHIERDPRAAELLTELYSYRASEQVHRAGFDELTERERETLAALAQGLTVQEIARTWVLSETTVRSHVRAILTKLDARSQLQAVVRAVQAGWITADPPAHLPS